MEPKQLMAPRCRTSAEGALVEKPASGYLFYIDKIAGTKPTLYLMSLSASGYAETVAKIDEIPESLITDALVENKEREYFGMLPINKSIQDWLKAQLGIQE